MWKKIKEFLDIKPPCYYEHQARLMLFEYLQKQREINKIHWDKIDMQNKVLMANKYCVTGVGSLIKN